LIKYPIGSDINENWWEYQIESKISFWSLLVFWFRSRPAPFLSSTVGRPPILFLEQSSRVADKKCKRLHHRVADLRDMGRQGDFVDCEQAVVRDIRLWKCKRLHYVKRCESVSLQKWNDVSAFSI
jgi:hypothetical protein